MITQSCLCTSFAAQVFISAAGDSKFEDVSVCCGDGIEGSCGGRELCHINRSSGSSPLLTLCSGLAGDSCCVHNIQARRVRRKSTCSRPHPSTHN